MITSGAPGMVPPAPGMVPPAGPMPGAYATAPPGAGAYMGAPGYPPPTGGFGMWTPKEEHHFYR